MSYPPGVAMNMSSPQTSPPPFGLPPNKSLPPLNPSLGQPPTMNAQFTPGAQVPLPQQTMATPSMSVQIPAFLQQQQSSKSSFPPLPQPGMGSPQSLSPSNVGASPTGPLSPLSQQPHLASPDLPSPKLANPTGLSPQMIMLLAVVKQARLYAVAAVQADMAGDYPTAAANYRAAVKSLKNEAANVPAEDSKAFNDRIVMYERRAELIELMKLGVVETQAEAERAELPVVRPSKDSFPDPLPEDDASRTFWLFRVLIKTLTTGGFVAPRVFVPRDVWYAQLPSVRLDQLPLKCGTCFTILEFLQKLQQIADFQDSSLIVDELQQFCDTLNTLQMLFAEKLPFVPKPRNPTDERVLKQVKKSMEREGGSDDVKKYAQALTNVMKEMLFLEKWVNYYATIMSATQINSLLSTVLTYFQTVFCPVVLSDLRSLLSKYMHRFEEQIVSTL